MIDSRQASFRHTPADTALAAAKPKDQSARRTGSRGGHPGEDSPVFPVPGPVLPWKQRAQAAKKGGAAWFFWGSPPSGSGGAEIH